MKDKLFYKIVRPLLVLYIKLYKPTVINSKAIKESGSAILAGNHTSYNDPLLVAYATKRQVHFFAKDSLYKGLKKVIFKGLGIIPVNRKIKDRNSLNMGIKVLNNNLVVGIFPEGTINKTNDVIMPFKYGAVKMAKETNATIVPFAITHKYKLLKKSVKIEFGDPYNVKDNDLTIENEKLMKIVSNLIKKEDVDSE